MQFMNDVAIDNPGRIVKVLWTGGYDLSFRMCQLSKLEVAIQSYYLSDNRHSELNELKAIEQINSDINNHPETKCTILPLFKYNVTDIEPDEEIYKGLSKVIFANTNWFSVRLVCEIC